MKFKYIEKISDAPKEVTILGYSFALGGKAVDIKEEDSAVSLKLKGMSHIGIVEVEEIDPEIAKRQAEIKKQLGSVASIKNINKLDKYLNSEYEEVKNAAIAKQQEISANGSN